MDVRPPHVNLARLLSSMPIDGSVNGSTRQPFKCLLSSQFSLANLSSVPLINAYDISNNMKSIEKMSVLNLRIILNTEFEEYFA